MKKKAYRALTQTFFTILRDLLNSRNREEGSKGIDIIFFLFIAVIFYRRNGEEGSWKIDTWIKHIPNGYK